MVANVVDTFESKIWLLRACACAALVGLLTLVASGDSPGDNDDYSRWDTSSWASKNHYHVHHWYHYPDADAAGRSVAAGNRAWPGYLSSGATPAPSTPFLGNTEDADPTEISDGPEVDDAGGDNEVGENVDQPSSSEPPDSQLPSSGAGSGQATQLQDRPSRAFGARTLPGDRAYLRVIVPALNTKLIYDGHEVPGQGLLRNLMTARIAPGKELAYSLVASWKDATGHPRVSVHEAAISAGDHETVEFNVAVADPADDNDSE